MMNKIKVGVISDTHGKLSPKAISALKGVAVIIHAGDFDQPEILARLQEIAPVKAVRGNMDQGTWSKALPRTEVVEIGEVNLFVVHDLEDLDINPQAAGMDAVIFGHYHRAEELERGGVLFLNPGSASYPRGSTQSSLVILSIEGKDLEVEFIDL